VVSILVFAAHSTFAGRGSAGRQYPQAAVGTVKGFTLARSGPVRFHNHPTPEELYQAAMRLYGSFRSAAASYHVVLTVQPKQGRAGKTHKRASAGEFRSKGPYNTLLVEWGTVDVAGPKTTYVYFRNTNTYLAMPRSELLSSKNPVAAWLGLIPYSDTHVTMRLLPDAWLRKTVTYVLEMVFVPKDSNDLRVVKRIYLGKSDLLPRRTVWIIEGATLQYDFNGFAVNPQLSQRLFPAGPPPGAKPAPRLR
jgi:outer membrane lipoprotein-sorting protein